MLEQKSKYFDSIRVFPFFISVFKADNIAEEKFSLQKLLKIGQAVIM